MKTVLLLFLILTFSQVDAAEVDAGTTAFDRLTNAAQIAMINKQDGSAQLKTDLEGIHATAQDLAALYKASLKKKQALNHLPHIYVASLDSDSAGLESFAASPKLPVDQQARVASGIHKDLGLKYDYAAGLTGGVFRSTIEVTVCTIHVDGKPAVGLWVRANPAIDGVTKVAMFPFNSASTPTTMLLPPGYLTMWVEASSGGFVVAQQEILLGSRDREPIRFSVP